MNASKNISRLKTLWKFVRPYKISFFNLFACISITTVTGMLYPYFFGMLVDQVFYHKNIDFYKVIVISFIILFLCEQFLYLILNSTWAYLMTRFLFDIRIKIFDKVLNLKAEYLSNSQTGDLITNINKDTDEIMNLVHMNIFYPLAGIIRFILCFILVAVINIKITLLMLILVPLSVYLSVYFGEKAKTQFLKYREIFGKYISWIFEIINGMREIKLFAGQRYVTKSFISYMSKLIHLKIKASIIELISERSNTLISLFISLGLYVLAGIFVLNGELTVGGFIAIIEYFSRAISTLKILNESYIKIQNNMASIDKVFALLDIDEEHQKELPDITINRGKIQYINIAFSYNERNEVLKKVNLTINEGEKISIVGRSGAGKSTMVSLLLKYFQPADGMVKIDEMDIQEYSTRSIRKSIGIVQQDTLLFDGTIKYNLRLGNPKCTDKEIWEACEKAHIDVFIRGLPQKLDTVLGTNGIELSGGQKQRIAIARIFLKNPKILIFDEATSALDYEAEQAIQSAWKELSFGRTTIIIAHRLSTILNSDRVAVLQNGVIVSCDHHLKLLETCQEYLTLFKEQYIGKEVVAV